MENIKPYGYELILDLHDCDATLFTRASITDYFIGVCDVIDMVRADLHFWDYDDVPDEERTEDSRQPHMDGISAIQFIETSNITIHTLHQLKSAYINMFSCKDFDSKIAEDFTTKWFKSETWTARFIDRI